jgi:hypothetical protein
VLPLASSGYDVVLSTLEEFADLIRSDVKKWADLIRSAGIRPSRLPSIGCVEFKIEHALASS